MSDQTDMTAAELDEIEAGLLEFGYSQYKNNRARNAIRSLRKQLDEGRAAAIEEAAKECACRADSIRDLASRPVGEREGK